MEWKNELELLVARVEEMRESQVAYFDRRKTWDLMQSKIKEKEVDEMLLRLRSRGINPDPFKQKTEQKKLF